MKVSISRSIKRRKMLAEGKRTTCPKCHAKLVEKPGYGTVCAECGWLKKEKKANEYRN